jgi:hypothetical protein
MLIAPSKLAGRFEETIEPLPEWRASRLRRAALRARDGRAEDVSGLLDTLFEDVIGLNRVQWVKGADVSKDYTRTSNAGETLRPARMWFGNNGARLAVFYPDQASGGLRVPSGYRIGVGRGRRSVVRLVEWLRKSNEKVALLATGRQLRLVHAGADYESFCEWDTDLWFQEGAPGPQVDALRLLLSTEALTPTQPGSLSPLLEAIAESRKGQAELSGVLGERVRQAVELLIQASGPQLLPLVQDAQRHVEERDVYLAATRLIMRCVIVLFAEARELLPRTNPIYEQSYGLQALRVELERQSGGRAAERLRTCYGAWPRLLGLFSLMFHGSEHEALLLTRYGGRLFEPGNAASDDPVTRAIAAFEHAEVRDADVQRILELLTRCPTRVRQGRGAVTVQTPVDFSDLGSEYLGILYEGLLDYELKRADDNDAVIFLGVGSEPALPFDVLNGMSNADLAELLKKLGKATKADEEDAEEAEPEEEDDEDEESSEHRDNEDDEAQPDPDAQDGRRVAREAVQYWAERAVKAAKLVPYPRKDDDPRVRDAFARKVTARAKALVRRLVLPGEWYLVRWGGTRKGSGTFYTRPQLAGPIVRRTLAPLCFDEADAGQDPRPRTPEQILALKVCDPAMGSGSFLVSALRYLTDALLQSLYVHGRLEKHADSWYIRLADGLPLDHPSQESLPVPKDDDNLDDILRARLKRHVVERCLYGVDLDALAVELARAALWVETMDYQLPFGFLDHKLKCGNSLVGAWLDRFEDYPIRAWDREGGDAKHGAAKQAKFVRHFREEKGKRKGDVWNAALRFHREQTIMPNLRSELMKLKAEVSGQTVAAFEMQGKDALALHADAVAVFEELHAIIPIFEAERRAEVYKTRVLGNPAFRALRFALDTWCSVWFWPGEKLDISPTPADLLDPRPETRVEIERLARELRFFHWELEFPDAMTGPAGGFSAIVGNPPWEIQKPNSMEFFSNEDPLYRTYGKQEALGKQTDFFRDRDGVEDRWLRYNARFKALSNWTKHAAFPCGTEGEQGEALGGIDSVLQAIWAERRALRPSFADRAHPYRHQGSADINTYKMFLEVAHSLLRRGGAFGFLVPAGIYTDNGSQELRNLFFDRCEWTHLYTFQNERFVFEGIHHSFKMAVLHARKGDRTSALRTRFRIGPGDSPEASEIEDDLSDDARFLVLPLERIKRFSPITRTILEMRSGRDLRVLDKLYSSGVTVGDSAPDGWGITYATEFHMTNDSELFPARPVWESKGYKPDEYGHWLSGRWKKVKRAGNPELGGEWCRDLVRSANGAECIGVDDIEDVALPLYQGIMLHAFDLTAKGWVSGTGLGAVWEDFAIGCAQVRPHYLMSTSKFRESKKSIDRWKVAFRPIARTTDTRTWIGAALNTVPAGHSISYLLPGDASADACVTLAAIANSFVYDWALRVRLGGTNLSWFVLEETAIPRFSTRMEGLRGLVTRLNFNHAMFAAVWKPQQLSWRRLWAVTPHERVRIRAILDAAVAELYGLDETDFQWILRDCDHPSALLRDKRFTRTLDPKGFWRVGRQQVSKTVGRRTTKSSHWPHPELRHPVLSLVAFYELRKIGLEKFLALNDGDGWQLPDTLRLADYGLGHDDRAKEHQRVSAALGDRFLSWQLGEDSAASWEECRRHGELIRRIISRDTADSAESPLRTVSAGQPMQIPLFVPAPVPTPDDNKRSKKKT